MIYPKDSFFPLNTYTDDPSLSIKINNDYFFKENFTDNLPNYPYSFSFLRLLNQSRNEKESYFIPRKDLTLSDDGKKLLEETDKLLDRFIDLNKEEENKKLTFLGGSTRPSFSATKTENDTILKNSSNILKLFNNIDSTLLQSSILKRDFEECIMLISILKKIFDAGFFSDDETLQGVIESSLVVFQKKCISKLFLINNLDDIKYDELLLKSLHFLSYVTFYVFERSRPSTIYTLLTTHERYFLEKCFIYLIKYNSNEITPYISDVDFFESFLHVPNENIEIIFKNFQLNNKFFRHDWSEKHISSNYLTDLRLRYASTSNEDEKEAIRIELANAETKYNFQRSYTDDITDSIINLESTFNFSIIRLYTEHISLSDKSMSKLSSIIYPFSFYYFRPGLDDEVIADFAESMNYAKNFHNNYSLIYHAKNYVKLLPKICETENQITNMTSFLIMFIRYNPVNLEDNIGFLHDMTNLFTNMYINNLIISDDNLATFVSSIYKSNTFNRLDERSSKTFKEVFDNSPSASSTNISSLLGQISASSVIIWSIKKYTEDELFFKEMIGKYFKNIDNLFPIYSPIPFDIDISLDTSFLSSESKIFENYHKILEGLKNEGDNEDFNEFIDNTDHGILEAFDNFANTLNGLSSFDLSSFTSSVSKKLSTASLVFAATLLPSSFSTPEYSIQPMRLYADTLTNNYIMQYWSTKTETKEQKLSSFDEYTSFITDLFKTDKEELKEELQRKGLRIKDSGNYNIVDNMLKAISLSNEEARNNMFTLPRMFTLEELNNIVLSIQSSMQNNPFANYFPMTTTPFFTVDEQNDLVKSYLKKVNLAIKDENTFVEKKNKNILERVFDFFSGSSDSAHVEYIEGEELFDEEKKDQNDSEGIALPLLPLPLPISKNKDKQQNKKRSSKKTIPTKTTETTDKLPSLYKEYSSLEDSYKRLTRFGFQSDTVRLNHQIKKANHIHDKMRAIRLEIKRLEFLNNQC